MKAPDKFRLPPLSSLRVFDAVARSLSVKDAADELGLTPSAVSHQLRNLEEHLGIALLHRRNRGVELTEAGAAFAAQIETAFRQLHHAVKQIREDPDSSILRVSTAPVFATELIMPNLHDFERRFPKIQLRLEMSEAPADFDSEPVDVAIRLGPALSANLFSEELFDIAVTLVCSPKLLEGSRPLRSIEDLQSHALISLSNQPSLATTWKRWVADAGYASLKPARELRFDTFIGALQAAESGLGFVLAPQVIISRRVAERRLVAPFSVATSLPWAYRFVCRRGQERLSKIDAFRRWIASITEAHRKTNAALAATE